VFRGLSLEGGSYKWDGYLDRILYADRDLEWLIVLWLEVDLGQRLWNSLFNSEDWSSLERE